jgi:hypothetical protein
MAESFPIKQVGMLVLVLAVGLPSCQALFFDPQETPPAIEQAEGD